MFHVTVFSNKSSISILNTYKRIKTIEFVVTLLVTEVFTPITCGSKNFSSSEKCC